jgi:Protein of unknown function (DUF2971)
MRAFRFLSTEYALQTLRTEEIKVSRFDDLNDPFELYGAELPNPAHRRTFSKFKRWASDRFGLLCFSRRWQNPLLWSHYGDRHRGVALEFEIHHDLVEEVKYSPYRLRLDIEKKLATGGFSEEDACRIAITKSAHWRYEEEVRVFVQLSECRSQNGLFFEPVGGEIHIVGIVLGPLCKLSQRAIESALPRGRQLHVTRSRLAFRSFVVRNRAVATRVVCGIA